MRFIGFEGTWLNRDYIRKLYVSYLGRDPKLPRYYVGLEVVRCNDYHDYHSDEMSKHDAEMLLRRMAAELNNGEAD